MPKSTKSKVGIRISTEPEPTGKRKFSELPFHILYVSNLTPRAQPPSDWSTESHLVDVDKQTFPDLMQRLAPSVVIDVPDHISGNPKGLEFELRFKDLKTLRPEGIAAQVPALSRLLQVRSLVEQVKRGEVPVSEFKARAEAAGLDSDLAKRFQDVLSAPPAPVAPVLPTTPPPIPSQDAKTKEPDKLGSLLDMVDLGGGEKVEKKPGAMDALLSAITSSEAAEGSPAGETAAGLEQTVADMLISDLDQMLGDQVNAVLSHPQLQHLESSWRGLKFLVDRIDFRKNVRLSVLAVPKAHLNDALYHQFLKPSSGVLRQLLKEIPISVVIADVEFGNTPSELEQLNDLAESMASMQVPLIAGVGPAFFAKSAPADIAELPVLWQYFERPEYVSWNSLRNQPASNYLVLALPRFLLRFAYGSDNPVKEFRFVEESGCWGNAAVAVASTLVRSFVDTGWPTHITGLHGGGRVEDLPLRENRTAGTRVRVPLDVIIPEEKQAELSEMGFTVLACRPNEDAAYVAFAPTVHRPERYQDDDSNEAARVHATLACQLMTSRIVQHLLRFERDVMTGLVPSRVREELVEFLRNLLRVGEKQLPRTAVNVEVSETPEPSDRLPLRIQVVSPSEILGREVNIVMSLQLARG